MDSPTSPPTMSSATPDGSDGSARTERIEVHGRVQGVGFRWWARHEAESLGITGTVRNRSDGVVEIEARGSREALEEFIDRLGHGPPTAHVDRVLREAAESVPSHGFEIVR